MDIVESVTNAVEPVISQMGYELVETEYKQKDGQMNLTLYVYKKGGMTLDDCEIVHRAVEVVIDELNPTEDEPYIFNVSSPGLDRPIVSDRDYERAIDTEIEVFLTELVDRKKKVVGTLVSKENDSITLIDKNKKIKIPVQYIKLCRPYIRF